MFAGFSRFLAVEDDFLNRMSNPFAYMRLFTHILAHSSFDHLKGKMMYLLLVGPSVEHEFGSTALIQIFGLVAFSSALVHILIGKPYTHQLGASGAVFSIILLNSLISATASTVPLSFVITALMWIGDEMWKLLFSSDNVSHHAHLTGAFIGTAMGVFIHRKKAVVRANKIASRWFQSSRKKQK